MGAEQNDGTATPHQHRLDDNPFVYFSTAKEVAEMFDFRPPSRQPRFEPFDLTPLISTEFTIGIVVGSSGSGKTQALLNAGFRPQEETETGSLRWNPDFCVLDHFAIGTVAVQLLTAAGFNSVPQWFKPFHMLSNGEQYRAQLARRLSVASSNKSILFVDEFTSVVDRTVARSLCESLNRHTITFPRIVVATCHRDVIEWLRHDWMVDTDSNEVVFPNQRRTTNYWTIALDEHVGTITRD
jgi:ABC-type ATPase with predicted acetyltransferase domain